MVGVVSGEHADEEEDDVDAVKKDAVVERESCRKDAVVPTSSTRLRRKTKEKCCEDSGSERVKKK